MEVGTAGRTPRQRGHRPLGDNADPDSESLEVSAEVSLQLHFSTFSRSKLTLEDSFAFDDFVHHDCTK